MTACGCHDPAVFGHRTDCARHPVHFGEIAPALAAARDHTQAVSGAPLNPAAGRPSPWDRFRMRP